jgi:predicted nucleic acid-binding protein
VHLIRGKTIGQRIAREHLLTQRPDKPFISIVTVGELKALALKLGWGATKQQVLTELVGELVVVNLNQGDILDRYAKIDHYSERVAKPARRMGKNDMWIAATAAALDAHLITTDSDFNHLEATHIRLVRVDPVSGASMI